MRRTTHEPENHVAQRPFPTLGDTEGILVEVPLFGVKTRRGLSANYRYPFLVGPRRNHPPPELNARSRGKKQKTTSFRDPRNELKEAGVDLGKTDSQARYSGKPAA